MDFSFIRLKPNFNQAKQMLDPKQSQKRYYDCISLHPQETYLQITGLEVNIVFGNSYKASIIDCDENELKDITDNVSIREAYDQFGVKQIAFEIVNIGQSWYGQAVFLKLESTIGSSVFYSNAFTVTDENTEETIRLNYKSFNYYQGTDYKNFNYFQSIRLRAIFNNTQDETENATYTQVDGNVLSQNPTIVFSESYTISEINNFTYRALSVALKSDIVYLDLYRVTDKPQLKNGEVLGRSNLTTSEFLLHRNLDEYFVENNQITTKFQIIDKFPIGTKRFDFGKIYVDFNKNIVLGVSGYLNIYKQGGFLQQTLYVSDFEVISNRLQSKENIVLENGMYYVTFTKDLAKSVNNEDIELTSINEWTFKISNGDWKDSDFKNTDFLIYI